MSTCSSVCAGHSPQPGDQFIFRGGDTWHNNNSAASPYTGGGWTWTWSGTSANPIYIGVDKTWSSGGSWTRPVMTDDNPLSTSSVSSCAYYGGGLSNQASYITFDNFEFTGRCIAGSNGFGASSCSSNCDTAIFDNGRATYSTLKNLYIHGWTHKTFNCSYTTMLTGNCDTLTSIYADSHAEGDVGNTYEANVIDGADTDRLSGGCMVYGGHDVHQSVCRYTSQGYVTNNTMYFHDNLIEYIEESQDGARHSNAFEMNGSNTALYWYNNVVRHMGNIHGLGVNLWFNPGGNLYLYNNLVYDIHSSGNYFDIAGTGGTYYLYNNTFQDPQIENQNYHPTMVSTNNHFIGSTSFSGAFLSSTNVTDSHSVYESDATATSQGYTAANLYAPTASNSPTVGAGVNLTSSCGTNFSQLCADTTLACSYDSTNHVMNCPVRTPNARSSSGAWDAGAYLFGGSTLPTPPINLTVTVR